MLYVYNKQDEIVENKKNLAKNVCVVSALHSYGLDNLREKVSKMLTKNYINRFIFLSYSCVKKRSDYISAGWVIQERQVIDGWWMEVSYPKDVNL